ncbi:MAG: UDP-N-acetylenolpyruvoylglucosamine reductase [Candidatus Poribacteria bacterium]|nr:MAG: UDP-N-acetylenolpyruvoylglucosamine reductase [Candidatus Poribacteria bacterium]
MPRPSPWINALRKIAELRIREDEPLWRHTSFKIGGPADALVWADTREQLRQVVRIAREYRVPFFVLGRGTNVLFDDAGFRGIVLKLSREFEMMQFDGRRVRAGAAVPMSVFSKECAKRGLSGAEFMFGIPGSLGGGVRMNAGAHGSCFAEIVQGCEALDWEGTFRWLTREELAFAYRSSALSDFALATEVLFELTASDPETVEQKTKALYYQRMASQPLAEPSAGCVFRNPDVGAAGKLIDECGLKGRSCGGAQVSKKHANYIVAPEGATAAEVRRLIAQIHREVLQARGVWLELEVKILGPHGEDLGAQLLGKGLEG